MSTNTFGKHQILIDADTAQTVLELIRTLDFQTLTKAQVMALNGLQLNLEVLIEEEHPEQIPEELEVKKLLLETR